MKHTPQFRRNPAERLTKQVRKELKQQRTIARERIEHKVREYYRQLPKFDNGTEDGF